MQIVTPREPRGGPRVPTFECRHLKCLMELTECSMKTHVTLERCANTDLSTFVWQVWIINEVCGKDFKQNP